MHNHHQRNTPRIRAFSEDPANPLYLASVVVVVLVVDDGGGAEEEEEEEEVIVCVVLVFS